MARKTFDQEMQDVKDDILLLGSRVQDAVMESVQALKDNDLERSRRLLANDRFIDRKRYEIEISILVLMATQQPIARDLRILASSLGVCTELERMGNYAKGIAVINLRSEGLSLPFILREIYSMADKVMKMLHRALTAFAEEDAQDAKSLMEYDDVIDECYTKLYADAMNNIIGDPRNIERINYVLWVAHNLERLGDRVTNICERIFYMVTGEYLEERVTPPAFTRLNYRN
jgi:phosphate transport system protein